MIWHLNLEYYLNVCVHYTNKQEISLKIDISVFDLKI